MDMWTSGDENSDKSKSFEERDQQVQLAPDMSLSNANTDLTLPRKGISNFQTTPISIYFFFLYRPTWTKRRVRTDLFSERLQCHGNLETVLFLCL